MKYILCFAILINSQFPFTAKAHFPENSTFATEKLPRTLYITGGVLSIIPGFGVGHIYQGRWLEKGWIFTVSEVAYLISIFYYIQKKDPDIELAYLFAGGWAGIKILEIADAWILPKKKYIITKSPFELKPFLAYNQKRGLDFNLLFNYKF